MLILWGKFSGGCADYCWIVAWEAREPWKLKVSLTWPLARVSLPLLPKTKSAPAPPLSSPVLNISYWLER
jgi:hypothetical protein